MSDHRRYKVWDTEKKMWITGVAMDPDGDLFFRMSSQWLNPNEFVVCQCSGLEDMKGALIFEGDILEFDTTSLARRTDTRREAVQYNMHDASFEVRVNRLPLMLNEIKAEIIGNIYENHDLLDPA